MRNKSRDPTPSTKRAAAKDSVDNDRAMFVLEEEEEDRLNFFFSNRTRGDEATFVSDVRARIKGGNTQHDEG